MKRNLRKATMLLAGAAALATSLATSPDDARASEPFIGQITMFGGNFAPRGWAFCDGQLLSISSNSALFSILGTTFGGDGRTTFGLPGLRGRTAVHPGSGPGLSNVLLGQRSGAENHTLTTQQMPSHTHTATATLRGQSAAGDREGPGGNSLAKDSRDDGYSTVAPNVDMMSTSVLVEVGNTGGNQSFSIRDPYLGINHIIALVGIFPSRN